MNEVMVREYLGNGIGFKLIDGMVYGNATEMCKSFDKKLAHWNENKSTKELLDVVSSEIGIPTSQLVISKRGNSSDFTQGSWIHEELILDLAQWLDVSFRRWCQKQITTLVREGSVSLQPQFKTPTTLKEALILALEQQEKIEELELENKNKEIKLIEQAPKVEFADKILKSKANVLIGDFAKVLCDEGLNIGEGRLFAWLRNNKILFKENGSNKPYQQYLDRGYFTCRENIVKTAFRDIISITTMLSPKGQVWLYNKLKEEQQFKK